MRPKTVRVAVGRIDGWRRGTGGIGQAAGSGSERNGRADALKSLPAIEVRGLLCRIDHSRLRLLGAPSTLLDWKDSPSPGEECPSNGSIHAVCRAGTMFILERRSNSL